jgi:3-hydroxy acid dehydrogenase/malonic semialdehyde reductase
LSKTAFVTGASAGFGDAIVRRLVGDGWRVVASARRAERLEALAEEMGGAVLAHPLDVTDARAVAALPDALPDGWREIDLLVNNAGLALGLGPAWEADLKDWDTMVATDVTGVLHVTRAFLPSMVARDRGLIVNLGSTAGRFAYPGGHVYGASKAFVEQFTMNLKADLIGTGVRVSCVMPGMVGGSEFSAVRFGGDAAKAAKVYEGVDPLTPQDIAETVGWLAALPPHMNVNRIELMPTCQAPAAPAVKRAP